MSPALPGYLFLVPWPVTEVGGVNQVVLNLCHQFEQGGAFTPRICVMSWRHKRPIARSEDGREVAYLRVRPPIAPGARGFESLRWLASWTLFLVPELVRIVRFLRAHRVACVNVHYPSAAALQIAFARRFVRDPPKIVLSFHGLDLTEAMRAPGFGRRAWTILLREADAIVSCSMAQTDALLQFAPFARSKASTIHNGLDAERLLAARNRGARLDPRLEGRRFVLSVASYEAKKGLDTLLQAFSRVRAGRGDDTMLALVGPDLGSGRELRALAARLGLADSVVFCGEIPHRDLHAYYERAEAFCLASRIEPFGIVLLEAGLFRCPVVATSVGGIPEIVQNGVTGCLVRPDDPAALAAALGRVLSDRALRERLASALHAHVLAHFAWRDRYRSYLEVLRRAGAMDVPDALASLALERGPSPRE